MKFIFAFLALTFALLPQYAACINSFVPGDTLYVWAVSGLKLRASDDLQSNALATIPYGTALVMETYQGEKNISVEAVPAFTNRGEKIPAVLLSGSMTRVHFNNIQGFIFDGYLCRLPPPRYALRDFGDGRRMRQFESLHPYLERVTGRKDSSAYRPDKHELSTWVNFGRGISINGKTLEKSGESRWILPDFSLEEAFLLFNYTNSYEEEVRHPSSNPLDFGWTFSTCDQQCLTFSNGGCSYKIVYLPEYKICILTGECSC